MSYELFLFGFALTNDCHFAADEVLTTNCHPERRRPDVGRRSEGSAVRPSGWIIPDAHSSRLLLPLPEDRRPNSHKRSALFYRDLKIPAHPH